MVSPVPYYILGNTPYTPVQLGKKLNLNAFTRKFKIVTESPSEEEGVRAMFPHPSRVRHFDGLVKSFYRGETMIAL